MTESELVRRARQGDAAALDEIAGRHVDLLHRVALIHVRDQGEAEDLVQESFEAAIRGLPRFEGRSSLKTWLVRILLNRIARRRRYLAIRKMEPLDSDHHRANGTYAARHADPGILLDVETMLESLPQEQRETLLLREAAGMSYDEIAATLGIPRGTVESRIHRARQSIRARYGAHFGYESPRKAAAEE